MQLPRCLRSSFAGRSGGTSAKVANKAAFGVCLCVFPALRCRQRGEAVIRTASYWIMYASNIYGLIKRSCGGRREVFVISWMLSSNAFSVFESHVEVVLLGGVWTRRFFLPAANFGVTKLESL